MVFTYLPDFDSRVAFDLPPLITPFVYWVDSMRILLMNSGMCVWTYAGWKALIVSVILLFQFVFNSFVDMPRQMLVRCDGKTLLNFRFCQALPPALFLVANLPIWDCQANGSTHCHGLSFIKSTHSCAPSQPALWPSVHARFHAWHHSS